MVELIEKSELESMITEMKAITNGSGDPQTDALYTVGSYQALQDAITEAEKVLGESEDATEISKAGKALKDAKDDLVSNTALRDGIKAAKDALAEGTYTAGSSSALQTAINSAETVLKNANATAAEVTGTSTALTTAQDGLVSVKELEEEIKVAEKFEADNKDKFIPSYAEALKKAIADAKTVAAKADAGKAEVTKALETLKQTVSAPKYKADKSGLTSLLEEYKSLLQDGDKYTEASFGAFKAAYEAAEGVSKDENALQPQVDNAIQTLKSAKDGLKDKESGGDNPNKPVQNPDGTVTVPNSDGSVSVTGEGVKLTWSLDVKPLTKEEREQVSAKIKDQAFLSQVKLENILAINLMDGDKIVQPNVKVKVRIKLDPNLIGKKLGIIYIAEDGSIELMKSTTKDDYLEFETTHFSQYGIISYPGTDPVNPGQPGQPGQQKPAAGGSTKTGDTAPVWLLMLLILASGGCIGLGVAKKKRRR